jgi:hypothetical protein
MEEKSTRSQLYRGKEKRQISFSGQREYLKYLLLRVLIEQKKGSQFFEVKIPSFVDRNTIIEQLRQKRLFAQIVTSYVPCSQCQHCTICNGPFVLKERLRIWVKPSSKTLERKFGS